MNAETHRQYILPMVARFMAPDDRAAEAVAQGIYNAGDAARRKINADGVECSVLLLNTRTEDIERIGYYSEDAMNEARAALIEGGGVDSPSRLLIEKAALLIEAAREAAEHQDYEEAALETADGDEMTFHEVVAIADDTPEIYRWPLGEIALGDEPTAMGALEEVIKEIMRQAVSYRLRGDAEREPDTDDEKAPFLATDHPDYDEAQRQEQERGQ